MIVIPLKVVPKSKQDAYIKHAFNIHEGAARQMCGVLRIVLDCKCCKIDDKARALAVEAVTYYEEQSR